MAPGPARAPARAPAREQCQFTAGGPRWIGRVARLAARQQGRVTYRQLRLLGVGETTIVAWIESQRLHPRRPGVYALGHTAATTESELWEAILYAGPGAMLSHWSAASRWGLIDELTPAVHVSGPRRRPSLPGIVVHGRRTLQRTDHAGVPVTSIPQTLLDLAAAGDLRLVRRALASLDFRDALDLSSLESICRRGRRGSALLRHALAHHDPKLARTLSVLEDDFLLQCEAHDIPEPDEVNVRVHGILCDAVYRDAKVIVELDGVGNHHSPAQIRRDRANDLILRSHGWLVLRYSWQQVHEDPAGIRAEIVRELAARSAAV